MKAAQKHINNEKHSLGVLSSLFHHIMLSGVNIVSQCETHRISLSLRPPGQHMEPSKLVFNFPKAVVKSAALTVALRELITNPCA